MNAALVIALCIAMAGALVYGIASANARNRERERRDKEAWERFQRGLAAGDAAMGREPDEVLRENDGRWR